MAITFAAIDVLMTAAIVALDAGDYATARRKAIAAQGRLALIPDSDRSAGSAGGSQKMSWTRESIAEFIKNLRREGNAVTGIQVSNVELDAMESLGVGHQSLGELGDT